MISRTRIILLVLAIILIGGGVYLFTRGDESELEDFDIDSEVRLEEKLPLEKNEASQITEYPEGALVYDINKGNVSYTAQKRFLQKEDEEVVGTTADINGAGWIDTEDGAVFIEVEGNLTNLATNDSGRDKEVLEMFNDSSIKIIVDANVSGDVEIGEPFDTDITSDVTINGITKEVTFKVTGEVDEESFSAVGTAVVDMSDFGIEPPSLAGINTIDDAIVIGFDVSGVRVN